MIAIPVASHGFKPATIAGAATAAPMGKLPSHSDQGSRAPEKVQTRQAQPDRKLDQFQELEKCKRRHLRSFWR